MYDGLHSAGQGSSVSCSANILYSHCLLNEFVCIINCLPVWQDRIRHLATDPVVMRSSPAMDIYVVHCWLINPNKLNLLSWLLAYLFDK